MVKKAMIMSAGVGSRLDPLTRDVPKPLVPIANIPVMDILLQHVSSEGIEKVIANTHYLGEKIQQRYKQNPNINLDFDYIHEDTLSGTAGGVKKCQFFFDKDEDFVVMSADGLTNVDLKNAIKSHKDSGSIATIITKEVPKTEVDKYGVIVLDENNFVKEFQEKPSIEKAKSNLINTGIYIFNYKIFDYIPESQFYDFAKDVFPKLLANNVKINTYTTKEYWNDIGSINQYVQSVNDILQNDIKICEIEIEKTLAACCIKGSGTKIDASALVLGNTVIGNNCVIKSDAKIVDSILWDNIEIDENVTVKNCIIASNAKIKTSIEDKAIEPNSEITLETLKRLEGKDK